MEEQIIRPQPERKWYIAAGVIGIVLLLVFCSWLILFRVNRFSLTIELNGAEKMNLEYGEAYAEPGFRAVLRGSLFWKDGIPMEIPVACSGELLEDTVGKYTLEYSAHVHGLTASAERSVHVVDTECPVITLVPDSEDLEPAPVYEDAGFRATDNYDGDITDKVIRTVEEGKVTYAVLDSSGNPAYAFREIPVYDITPPVIKLEGGEDLVLTIGTLYEEPGFTAIDNHDGDITEAVEVEEVEIDRFQPGEYEINYRAADSKENETVVTRHVSVQAQPHPKEVFPEGKVIYLTFDDGPCEDTERLLDVLAQYGVKATFFVVDTGYPEIMKRIVEEGHSIAVHTMSHDYSEIYTGLDAYFDDLLGMQQVIYEATGVRTTLMRFPGGSSNTVSRRFKKNIMTELTQLVEDAGFSYFDWNVDSDDAGGATKASQVIHNVEEGVSKARISVVLQHDIHPFSVSAVEEIVQWGLDNGYTFLPLEANSPSMHHGPQN